MHKSIRTGIGAGIAMLIIIIDGKVALEGAYQGIKLCYMTVIPSLFPFLFLSVILTSSLSGISSPSLKPIGRLFRIPESCESILLSAFLGGYPAGAHSISAAYTSGVLTKENAERMLPYCNNAGPAFVFGMVGSMFPSRWMVWALWIIHIFSAYLVSLLSPATPQKATAFFKKDLTIADAMHSATGIMVQICGWVVLFRIILCFLNRWILWLLPMPLQVMVTGFLELSNGCWELRQIDNIPLRFILCSAMLSFGGICVIMQTMSATGNLSLRSYFRGKLVQTFFSILLSAAIILNMWSLIPVIIGYFLIINYNSKNKCGNMETIHV